jgi:Putative endonuclease segE, GIY-YIG domain
MAWLYDGKEIEEVDPKYVGFVYNITNLCNNRQYIGKKLLQFKRTKQVKGKKKGYYIESDWKTYFGSNNELNEDVKSLGENNFKREIMRFCISKGELSYWEAKFQFQYDVLLHPEKYYNGWIMVKTRRSHVLTKALLSEQEKLK